MIGQSFAQSSKMSFFIRPLLETKLDFASSNDYKFTDKVFQFDDRFEYDNIMIKPLKYYSINAGLFVGLKTKNKKHIIELGIEGDGTQSGYYLNFKTMNQETPNNYYSTQTMLITGIGFNRFTLQHAYLLNKNTRKSNKYYFNSGLSLGFKAPKDFKQTSSGSYLVDTDTYIVVVDNLDISTRLKYLFGQIGLSGEMHINKKYWFDFSIFVNKKIGRRYNFISNLRTSVTVVEANEENKTYYFQSISNGTGIYFQLSRKLQFYPRKKKIEKI